MGVMRSVHTVLRDDPDREDEQHEYFASMDDRAAEAERTVEDDFIHEELLCVLRKTFDGLSKKQKRIVDGRWDGKTLAEIATEESNCRERIRQIDHRSRRRLMRAVRERDDEIEQEVNRVHVLKHFQPAPVSDYYSGLADRAGSSHPWYVFVRGGVPMPVAMERNRKALGCIVSKTAEDLGDFLRIAYLKDPLHWSVGGAMWQTVGIQGISTAHCWVLGCSGPLWNAHDLSRIEL